MKIPASPTAVLGVAPSSANRLLFLLVAKPQPDPLYTPASPCQEKGQQLYLLPPSFVIFCWKHPFSLGNSNHITDISSRNQPMRIMNTFNGSVAGISCFIYSSIAFLMEIKCKRTDSLVLQSDIPRTAETLCTSPWQRTAKQAVIRRLTHNAPKGCDWDFYGKQEFQQTLVTLLLLDLATAWEVTAISLHNRVLLV